MNKRLFLFFLIFCSGFVYPQSKSKAYFDSLFSKYVNMRTAKKDMKKPAAEISPDEINKCGMSLANELRFNFKLLSAQQQAVLKPLLDRPALQQSIVSPSGKFRIHFNAEGTDAPKYVKTLGARENAALVAQKFDSSYSFEVEKLGFLPPPGDGTDGGDSLYDVYLIDYHSYGETNFENSVGPNIYTSYIVMDNNYDNSDNVASVSYGINGARVTAAHEFHHAIQGGRYKLDMDEIYFHELTSTSMEEFVFSDVNDYYQYLKTYFNNPQNSFSKPDDNGYSLGIWNIFLKEELGNSGFDIIRRQWELFRVNPALSSINLSLAEQQTSFKYQLSVFSKWCYFTNYRKIAGKYFTEGDKYPLVKPTCSTDFSSNEKKWTLSTKPLSNNYIRILCNNGQYIDTIYSIITNGDFNTGLNSPNTDLQSELWLYNYNASDSKHISNNYYLKFTSDNNDNYIETNIFNNLLTDTTYSFETIDYAFPNPFRYTKYSEIYLPAEYNANKSARYYIYSIDMKLVCSGYNKVLTLYDKFVVRWDGLDNDKKRLSSGVYIYVTDSDDKIKKGKIVIFNE